MPPGRANRGAGAARCAAAPGRGDPNLVAGGQAALVPLAPVGPGRPLMVKVGVDIDQHCHNLRRFYLGGSSGGSFWMETLTSRARAVLFEPRATFKEVDSEFTKPGTIWGKYVIPLAVIGPLMGALGRLVFGRRMGGATPGDHL